MIETRERYHASVAGSVSRAPSTNIDGFFRNPRSARAPMPVAAHTASVAVPITGISAEQVVVKSSHSVASHANPHKPQTPVTLMRAAVTPPKPSLKSHTRVQASMLHKVPSLIASKRSVYSLDADRLARAQETAQSPHITHHASHEHALHVPVTMVPLAVQPVPTKPEATDPTPTAPHTTNKPASTPLDIFEHALANASHYVDVKAHSAHFKKHRRMHLASFTAGGFALVVIAGFAAYQNSPGLQLRIASLQSGVSARMPNFKAAGFNYNGAHAGRGNLTVGFSGKQGTYELSQQTSNLSSDDMIQNIGATDASGYPTYATVQAGDTTVYRFNNTDATWVSSGKWYTLSGTSALTDSQVTSLVKSL